MEKETDPAYFTPEEWTTVEADNPLEEHYFNTITQKSISPEKFHQLYHDRKVIDKADVTRNDDIREQLEYITARVDENENKFVNSNMDLYGGISIGRRRSKKEFEYLLGGDC